MKFNYAMIMAAGKGERLKPFTDVQPKALLNVDEIPLISYSLRQLINNIGHISITVGHQAEQVKQLVLNEGANTVLNTYGKDNAWWVFNTFLKDINEPVLVLPCDIITYLDFEFIYNNYLEAGSPMCLLIPVEPLAEIEGDYIFGKDGIVTSLSREKVSNVYCSGIQVLNPYRINQVLRKSFDFNLIWSELIEMNEVFYSNVYPHAWYSINTYDQFTKFDKLRLNKLA